MPSKLTETVNPRKTKSTPYSSGVRAHAKAQNRAKILESAKLLFCSNGFEAATMRDIAAQVGLSTGALFANFDDKNDIFLTLCQSETQKVIEAMDKAYQPELDLENRIYLVLSAAFETAKPNLRMLMDAMAMKWGHDPRLAKAISSLGDAFKTKIVSILEDAVLRGELIENTPSVVIAEMIEDLCYANLRRLIMCDIDLVLSDQNSRSNRTRHQINLLLDGVKIQNEKT